MKCCLISRIVAESQGSAKLRVLAHVCAVFRCHAIWNPLKVLFKPACVACGMPWLVFVVAIFMPLRTFIFQFTGRHQSSLNYRDISKWFIINTRMKKDSVYYFWECIVWVGHLGDDCMHELTDCSSALIHRYLGITREGWPAFVLAVGLEPTSVDLQWQSACWRNDLNGQNASTCNVKSVAAITWWRLVRFAGPTVKSQTVKQGRLVYFWSSQNISRRIWLKYWDNLLSHKQATNCSTRSCN